MLPTALTAGWLFWVVWGVAFIGFPIGGLGANLIVGPLSNPLAGAIGGVITGAFIGTAEWYVLQGRLPVPTTWIVATAVGLAAGLAASIAVFGSDNDDRAFFGRAAVGGVCIGLGQWLVLLPLLPLPQSILWVAVIGVAWVAGWVVTRAAGIDLDQKWSVFGTSGALTFQMIAGLGLFALLSVSSN